MRRILLTLGMSAISALCLAACSGSNDAATENAETDNNSSDTVSVTDRIETTTAVPADFFNSAAQQGRVEVVNYESKDYTQSSLPVTHKPAYVYLPYGYDAGKKYDIIYLMHGRTGTAQEYFGMESRQQMKNLFDNMIEQGLVRPFIAVSPTWDKDNEAKGWGESTNEVAAFYNEYEQDTRKSDCFC